jgi:hypothetical protein
MLELLILEINSFDNRSVLNIFYAANKATTANKAIIDLVIFSFFKFLNYWYPGFCINLLFDARAVAGWE